MRGKVKPFFRNKEFRGNKYFKLHLLCVFPRLSQPSENFTLQGCQGRNGFPRKSICFFFCVIKSSDKLFSIIPRIRHAAPVLAFLALYRTFPNSASIRLDRWIQERLMRGSDATRRRPRACGQRRQQCPGKRVG
jgi:hypothetical protein